MCSLWSWLPVNFSVVCFHHFRDHNNSFIVTRSIRTSAMIDELYKQSSTAHCLWQLQLGKGNSHHAMRQRFISTFIRPPLSIITGVGPTRSYLTARLYCRIVYPRRTMRIETQYLCVCIACLLSTCVHATSCLCFVSSAIRLLARPPRHQFDPAPSEALYRCTTKRRDWPNIDKNRDIHTY